MLKQSAVVLHRQKSDISKIDNAKHSREKVAVEI